MVETKQVGVIGCGYWGRNLVRNFYQLGALRAICDSDPDCLAVQTGTYPGLETHRRLSELLSDPEVSAVAIATPAATHFELARQALLAGKDVFVEKPLALRVEDGEGLISLAERTGRILMVGHLLEYHPAIRQLRELVRKGELGEIHYIYSNRLNLGRVRREENILWSFAPHDISTLLAITGELPLEVSASGGSYLQKGIADVTVTHLLFASGTRAHIFVSWLHPFKEHKLVIVGSAKMAVFNDTAEREKLKIYDKGIEWVNGSPLARETAETLLFFPAGEPLANECRHFLESIEKRTPPRTDGREGLRVLKVLEACQGSMERGGAPVKLGFAAREVMIGS